MDFTSTEETVGWFRDRYAEGSLTIKPPYQRKPVWGARQKCHLVESVLNRYPIPELFVQRATDAEGKTTYAVVDGQQRLRALLQFVGSDPTPEEEEFDKFTLDKLEPSSPWYLKTFADLVDTERVAFYGYELAVRYLNTNDEEALKDVFRRLNKFTVPLTPQELRNATYEGPFAKAVEKLAEEHTDLLAENRIVTVAAIRRMADVELMAELLAGAMYGPQGGSAKAIDETYATFEDYETEFPGQRKAITTFRRSLEATAAVVPDLRTARWGNKTDFYTLFVALSHYGRAGLLPLTARNRNLVRKALDEFATQVETLLENEKAKVPARVTKYVRNVQRGANDKARRAERHAALLEILDPILVKD